jgi:hypothetical protein
MTSALPAVSSPTISKEYIAERVAAINPQQIVVISKWVIANIMERFEYDVCRGQVGQQMHRDTSGALHPVMGMLYNPSSLMMTHLLPVVAGQLTVAFSETNQFIEHGKELVVADSRSGTGLVQQIPDKQVQEHVKAKIQEIIRDWQLNTLVIRLHLKLNVDRSIKWSESEFDLNKSMNGTNVGHACGRMSRLQEKARDTIV